MQFRILATGSSGNCFLARSGDTLVAIDCGVAPAQMARTLAEDDLALSDLSAILLTHEHRDHAGELNAVAQQAGCPVHLTAGTFEALGCPDLPQAHCFDSMTPDPQIQIGTLSAHPVPVLHDAREPVAWTLTESDRRLGVLTDTGSVSPTLTRAFSNCHLLALEFNHDLTMLQNGTYTDSLKRRIASNRGHLNNHQARDFLAEVKPKDRLLAVHVSENNNTPDLVETLIRQTLPTTEAHVMPQRQPSPWFQV